MKLTRNRKISLVEWGVTLGVIAADWICAKSTGVYPTASISSIEALSIIVLLWPVTFILLHITGFASGAEVIAENAAKFFVFIVATSALEYYLAMSPLPLHDELLANTDKSLGFVWPDFYAWVKAHALVKRVLVFCYFTLMYEAGLVLVLVSMFYPKRANRFPTALIVSASLTLPLLGLFPVAGPCVYFGHQELGQAIYAEHYLALRAHSMTEIPMDNLRGLINFPSFHVASALIMTYFLRGFRLIFPAALLINLGMAIGALPVGGHYFCDVLGGVCVALATIAIVRHLEGPEPETRLPLFRTRPNPSKIEISSAQ